MPTVCRHPGVLYTCALASPGPRQWGHDTETHGRYTECPPAWDTLHPLAPRPPCLPCRVSHALCSCSPSLASLPLPLPAEAHRPLSCEGRPFPAAQGRHPGAVLPRPLGSGALAEARADLPSRGGLRGLAPASQASTVAQPPCLMADTAAGPPGTAGRQPLLLLPMAMSLWP